MNKIFRSTAIALCAACSMLTLPACFWKAAHDNAPAPAGAAAPSSADEPAKPADSPVPSLQSVVAAPAPEPGKQAAPASGKARIEQVKEIMAAKEGVEKQYETKSRGADPNAFYRYKPEAAQTSKLVDDGIHDPKLDLGELQQPLDAFKPFPQEMFGNTVNWVKAFREGKIAPRAAREGDKDQFTMDMNIQMPVAGTMNDVVFPHKVHTEWLACQNCHTAIFQMQRGANPITMEKIVKGEYCGACHGKVAFPIANCNRCHTAASKLSASKK